MSVAFGFLLMVRGLSEGVMFCKGHVTVADVGGYWELRL